MKCPFTHRTVAGGWCSEFERYTGIQLEHGETVTIRIQIEEREPVRDTRVRRIQEAYAYREEVQEAPRHEPVTVGHMASPTAQPSVNVIRHGTSEAMQTFACRLRDDT